MARAHASTIVKAPIETVWNIVRDFNGLPNWVSGVAKSKIEDGLDADVVGCVRSFYLNDGMHVRERLLALDDARHTFTYNFEKPAFPIENYRATIRLLPVTHSDTTFAEWEASFDEHPGDEGKYESHISKSVFEAGWKSLKAKIAREKPAKPAGAVRWKAWAPNKIWTSRVLKVPIERAWAKMRDFAGMGAWHEEVSKMRMLDKARPDKVSGVRDFYFGDERLNEELLHLCDVTRSFSYRITKGDIPWMHYVSGPRLWPISSDNTTFAVWTGDWVASPHDDLTLIPRTEENVYQRALATLEKTLLRK